MVFDEWEMKTIIDSLKKNDGNMMTSLVIDKLEKLQASSKNKRYTFRSTDWLSEASKKRATMKRKKYADGGLL